MCDEFPAELCKSARGYMGSDIGHKLQIHKAVVHT
jgi:hypothetical protein